MIIESFKKPAKNDILIFDGKELQPIAKESITKELQEQVISLKEEMKELKEHNALIEEKLQNIKNILIEINNK